MNRFMSMGVAVLATLAIAAPVAAADQRPIVLEFLKTGANGHYLGTIEGGGTIEMQLFDSETRVNTQHFSAVVDVTLPDASFRAVVSGKINFTTGRVVLNGAVTDGDYEGAQVHEESQLIWETGAFEGSLQIMPGS